MGFHLAVHVGVHETILLFLAPALVTLALKVHSLVGIKQAPNSLALVAAIGALLSMAANPFCGKMSDRTWSQMGMRRPWMVTGLVGGSVGILVVALAPTIAVVLLGWCIAQLFFNALLAAMVAVLPDHVPTVQRGLVSGVLGVCLPIASVTGTYLVKLFTGNQLATFLAPCAVGGFFILLFAVTLKDRRLAKGDRPTWSLRELASTFYVSPRKSPDFRGGLRQPLHVRSGLCLPDDVPGLLLAEQDRQRRGRCATTDLPGHSRSVRRPRLRFPDRWQALGPQRPTEGLCLHRLNPVWRGVVRGRDRQQLQRFPRGMALSGLGFSLYMAVDLALVVDVLPDMDNAAKDLGVLNIAGALPFSVAPALAPAVLAIGGGSYGVLYAVAGLCAIIGAFAILRVKSVR